MVLEIILLLSMFVVNKDLYKKLLLMMLNSKTKGLSNNQEVFVYALFHQVSPCKFNLQFFILMATEFDIRLLKYWLK